MKTSYVHVQTPFGRSLGFSALLTQMNLGSCDEHRLDPDGSGHQMVEIAITFCNRKDKHFCKATARVELAKKELKLVRVRDVPKMLAEAFAKAAYVDSHALAPHHLKSLTRDFNYVLRRFV